ncbi:hypothetical protein KFE98_08130 [bacterium SCSIO 12741]|nr:hypothetical protein KFE98_08130 [bacterium SCSIO 12741]
MTLELILGILQKLGIAVKVAPKTLMVIKGGIKVLVGIDKTGKVTLGDAGYLAKVLHIKL